MTAEELQRFLVSARLSIDEHSGSQFLHKEPLPVVKCKDGFSMSVQASHFHYCKPRVIIAWPSFESYTHVEVGFPSGTEELLMPYVEDKSNPTDTVYPFVPVGVVLEVIEKHGGKI